MTATTAATATAHVETALEIDYEPGFWVGMAATGLVLLVETYPASPALRRCWQAICQETDTDRLLAAVLDVLPSDAGFALLCYAPEPIRVVVRGRALVESIAVTGEVTGYRADGSSGHVDHRIQMRPAGIRLTTALGGAGASLPVREGVVLASAIEIQLVGGAEVDADADRQPTEPLSRGRAEIADPPSSQSTDDPDDSDLRWFSDPLTDYSPQKSGPVIPLDPETTFERPSARPAAPYREPEPLGLIEDLPWAFVAEAGDVTDSRSAGSYTGQASPARPVSPAFTAPSEDDISSTVFRPGWSPEPSAGSQATTTVSAVHCASGHLSPPEAELCRVCGTAVPLQRPSMVTRPALGVLRLSTGDVIQLDRDVIIGREPTIPEGRRGLRPHLLRLESPDRDISRNHLEIRLDGWRVLVSDLGSLNGTFVTPSGRPAEKLAPGGTRVIEPGSVVSLSEDKSFVFEVTP